MRDTKKCWHCISRSQVAVPVGGGHRKRAPLRGAAGCRAARGTGGSAGETPGSRCRPPGRGRRGPARRASRVALITSSSKSPNLRTVTIKVSVAEEFINSTQVIILGMGGKLEVLAILAKSLSSARFVSARAAKDLPGGSNVAEF